jgi:hypothetical protein
VSGRRGGKGTKGQLTYDMSLALTHFERLGEDETLHPILQLLWSATVNIAEIRTTHLSSIHILHSRKSALGHRPSPHIIQYPLPHAQVEGVFRGLPVSL